MKRKFQIPSESINLKKSSVSSKITDKFVMKNYLFTLTAICCLLLTVSTAKSQEFPVAVTYSGEYFNGEAFDGTNHLLVMSGDNDTKEVSAQLISGNGTKIGSKITIGTGGNPKVAFDGTNYFVVWHENYFFSFGSGNAPGETTGKLFGQFITKNGNLSGASFPVAEGVSSRFYREGALSFCGSYYFLVYSVGNDDEDIPYVMYGQKISKSGNLTGNPVLISSNTPRDISIACDGVNYLVVWVDDNDSENDGNMVHGQIVTKEGVLSGTEFVIDSDPASSSNPTSVASDGSMFLVAYHEAVTNNTGESWELYARFVSNSGVVSPDRILIADTTQIPLAPALAFNGTKYLITWVSMFSGELKGRYYDASGNASEPSFSLFETLDGKFPLGGVGTYSNDGFFIGATRIKYVDGAFTGGDVYGRFLHPNSTAVIETKDDDRSGFIYPNPVTDEFVLSGFEGIAKVDFYNIDGKIISSGQVVPGEKISVGNLESGFYLLKISTEHAVYQQKLIRQ